MRSTRISCCRFRTTKWFTAKGALIGKMPGDNWQQFANLRLLYGYMWAHPGKKLLFMGGEFGQRREWQHEEALEWWVLQYPEHGGLMQWIADLNRVYVAERALHSVDFEGQGFEWIDANDAETSSLSFIRRSRDGKSVVVVACNFTPVPRENYLLGVPRPGYWREAPEFRCVLLRRQRSGQSRRRRVASGARARPLPRHTHNAAAARGRLLPA